MKNYKSIAISLLAFSAILTIVAGWKVQDLRFDYEFEDYFPKSDTEYAYYDNFRKTYGSDNDFVLISIIRSEGIFNSEFLLNVDSLANQLKDVTVVEKVISPTQLSFPINSPFGMSTVKWMHVSQPDRLEADSLRIFESQELVGSFIASNAQSLTLMLNTTYGLSKVKSDQAVASINAVLDQYDFDEIKVAGRIFGQKHYVEKMVGELFWFTLISFLIIILFLILAFRSVWGVVFPLLIVATSVIWLVALMTFIGKSFDLMSTLLPTIMFVVGMSDAVHFISRYLEELRHNNSRAIALRITFSHIGKATFLTSITTAIGFLTLMTSGIKPVKDFGIYTAVGVMLAFLITYLVLPAVLYLLPTPKRALVQSEELFWNRIMRQIFAYNISKPWRVLSLSVLVVLISLYGLSRVEVNNFLLEDLSEGDEMRAQFEFFEKEYSGARPFDVVISTVDSSKFFTQSNVMALNQIEEVLKHHLNMKGLASVNTVIKNLNRANSGGAQSTYIIPNNNADWLKIEKQFLKLEKQGKLKMFLNENGNATRISAQVKDFGGKVFKEKYELIYKELQHVLDQSGLTMKFTGMAYLIDKNNETLASSLMYGLVLAFGAVALIMGFIFKSLKMVLITLIPNVVPLLIVGGFMGFAGIDLKVSTSIIFTIAFGIAVDNTIHYVSKLKMELNKGRSMLYALKRTSISTGKAIVLTSLILISGFFALIFSDFTSTHYIGLLVSITLVFAVLADLFLLPVLILLFYRKS